MSGTMTYNQISEETGIPASSVGYINRGERDVPMVYRTSANNAYRTIAYDNLRQTGLSSVQSNRFKWYTPEKVLDVENSMSSTLLKFTLGATAEKISAMGGEISGKEIMSIFDAELSIMKKALQRSPHPMEDIIGEKY
jgi:hypothetical protein